MHTRGMRRSLCALLMAQTLHAGTSESATRMVKFFQGAPPALMSAYARVARSESEATAAGVFNTDVLGAAAAVQPPAASSLLASEKDMELVSLALDYFQERLCTKFGGPNEDEGGSEELDEDFLEEGRRLLAIGSFQVLSDASDFDAAELCLGELCRMVEDGADDAGALVLLPGFDSDVATFAEDFLRKPLPWLGLASQIYVDAVRPTSGAPVPLVRLFHGLSAVPPPTKVEATYLTPKDIVDAFGDEGGA